jgi:hypothetical protein
MTGAVADHYGLLARAVKAGRKLGQFCRSKTRPLEGWFAGGFRSEP